jgi:predicted O-methyltransferase YrrM
VNRRASLPGVDELFGARPHAPATRRPTGDAGPPEEPVMADDETLAAGLAVLQQVVAGEDPTVNAARTEAEHLAVPSPEVGALLRWVVADRGVRAVVEVGSAGGVSGLWMLPAMPAGGVLTSLEPDPEAHRLAAAALETSPTDCRVRSIQGEATTLLERLADRGYDLVLLQGDHGGYPDHLERARSLLHPGGLLIARGILPVGEHREPLRRFLHDLVEDPAFSVTVLPIDDGLALATRLPDPA